MSPATALVLHFFHTWFSIVLLFLQQFGSMRYSGYQIAFFLYGKFKHHNTFAEIAPFFSISAWSILLLIVLIVLLVLCYLIIIPIRDKQSNFVLRFLGQYWWVSQAMTSVQCHLICFASGQWPLYQSSCITLSFWCVSSVSYKKVDLSWRWITGESEICKWHALTFNCMKCHTIILKDV
jgi:hypothetical protein